MRAFITGVRVVCREPDDALSVPSIGLEFMMTSSGLTMTSSVDGSRLMYISSSSAAVHLPEIVLCPLADMTVLSEVCSEMDRVEVMVMSPLAASVLTNVSTGIYDDADGEFSISFSGAPDQEPCMSLASLVADSHDERLSTATDKAIPESRFVFMIPMFVNNNISIYELVVWLT